MIPINAGSYIRGFTQQDPQCPVMTNTVIGRA